MALAVGAKTYKLRFGHRSQNQPCLYIPTNRAYLTSQNHGYAIDETTLPAGWRVSFRNLNDDSVAGLNTIHSHSSPCNSIQNRHRSGRYRVVIQEVHGSNLNL